MKEAAILKSAEKLIARKPLSEITIEDLVKGADISRSSFYFYFESKEAVMRALSASVTEQIRGSATPFFKADARMTHASLREGVVGYLTRWKNHGHLMRANALMAEIDPAMRGFWTGVTEEILTALGADIDERRAANELPPGPPGKDLARVLFSMLWHTGFYLSQRPFTHAEEERIIDAAAVVMQRALGVRP